MGMNLSQEELAILKRQAAQEFLEEV